MADGPGKAVQQDDSLGHARILTDTHNLIAAFVDELVRCGVADACTSPGSRSAPLVLALARADGLRAYSHVDERCAGFFALGLAKASGRPVVIACTSGTAAANLAPAVIEASEARVPLIVLTADRPPELREVGAGQTIDQLKLYGSAVRWFFEVGNHDADETRIRWVRTLACRAVAEACAERPGPVHLNWPLREPLIPQGGVEPLGGRPGGEPWLVREPPPPVHGDLATVVSRSARGVIVAGRSDQPLTALPALAEACRYPLLADPLSGARSGAAAVAHYDVLLRDRSFADEQRPEVVIRVGDLPTSKPLRGWLSRLEDAQQIAIDPACAWQDPDGRLNLSLRADPGTLEPPPPAAQAWLEGWRAADATAAALLEQTLGGALSELAVARLLGAELPGDATLFVASSMPVRLIETAWPARAAPPRVLCNRGANGIDGTISSAFGVAAGSAGPAWGLIGDVAFAHDVGGLLAARRLRLALTIVLLDNGGGAIFDLLPIASASDVFEEHVATPTGLDFEALARAYAIDYTAIDSLSALRSVLSAAPVPAASRLLHVRTERAAGLALQRALSAAIAADARSTVSSGPGAELRA
jgi:2-succinyl-5-enolpyruvyl-6-hydroxy-3-cyclohexene-1-carboxylate synthase